MSLPKKERGAAAMAELEELRLQFRAAAMNAYRGSVAATLDPKRLQTGERAGAISAGREIFQFRCTLSDCPKHRVTMRN